MLRLLLKKKDKNQKAKMENTNRRIWMEKKLHILLTHFYFYCDL